MTHMGIWQILYGKLYDIAIEKSQANSGTSLPIVYSEKREPR